MMPEVASPAPASAEVPAEKDPTADFKSEEYTQGKLVEALPVSAPVVEAKEDDGGDELVDVDFTGDKTIKNKVPAKERITELSRARHAAEQRALAAERRAQELEAKLNTPVQKTEPEKAPEKVEAKGPPKPEDFEFGELDSRFIRALARYEGQQMIAEYQAEQKAQQEARAEQDRKAQVKQKFDQQVAKATEKYEDFEDKVFGGAERGEWALTPDLATILAESNVAADIAYHLATHPEESLQVSRQSPLEQARWFGRMEAKFSAEQQAASNGNTVEHAAPAKTPPKAPPPVTPARGAGGRFQTPASTDDFAAFERMANAELQNG